MLTLYEKAKMRYIALKGLNAYNKLYDKISHSDALTELCGESVRRSMAPLSGDFIYKASMMPSIFISFDSAKSAMAALIMLKIWHKKVNSVYNFCSADQLYWIADDIVASSLGQLR